ncbi:hypothetical protein X975_01806, partial [Stegodyphus mimosarum]
MVEINFSAEELVASMAPIPSYVTSVPEDVMKSSANSFEPNFTTLLNVNASDPAEEAFDYPFEYWQRHSIEISAVFCVAYSLVFLLGILGNSFVVAVVLRSPRMR